MAIQDNGTKDQYSAAAGQTVFPYTFEVFQKEDLTVTQKGLVIAEGTDYTVSGIGSDSGGNITLTVGATVNDEITVFRDMSLERLTDYQNNGDFLSSDVNKDFDRLWSALQQVDAKITVTISEDGGLIFTQTLGAGQTNVTAQADANTSIFFVSELSTSGLSKRLTKNIDYEIVDSKNITLFKSYEDGSHFTEEGAASLGLNFRSLKQTNYKTMSEWSADGLASFGDIAMIEDRGFSRYAIISGTGSANTFGIVAHDKLSLSASLIKEHKTSVESYGADGTFPSTTDQTTFFQAAADANEDGSIRIPAGAYRVDSAITTDTTWILEPDVTFVNLPGISPSFVFDLTQLGGNVIVNRETDKSGSLYVGDPSYTVQAVTGRAQTTGSVVGASTNGAVGVGGFTHTSGKPSEDQGSQAGTFRGLNDQTGFNTEVWGCYIEAIKQAGVNGITLGQEIAAINKGAVVSFEPPDLVVNKTGFITCEWFSAGIGSGSDTQISMFAGYTSNTSATGKALRGLVFQEGSTTTQEVICLSRGDEIAWWDLAAQQDAKLSYITGADGGSSRGQVRIGTKNTSGGSFTEYNFNTASFHYSVDNSANLGEASGRWKEIFSANATINTSDERDKQQGRSLSAAELSVAISCKSLIKMYKWNDAVEEKGADARWHCGAYAQEVKAAFEAEGLDAHDYGILCYDEWEEELDDIGGVIKVAGNRYGLRYTELLAFIIASL